MKLDRGGVGAAMGLRRLATTASVLHVVAHPDDEDGPLLAYASRGLGARVMLFSITRGEGGANLISSHFFDQLGALRTLEHLKAASYYGNELFYSHAADYGYSKTLAEAMRQWQKGQPILRDLVEVIRRERPTVIVARFRGDPRDGHGHHQMAGMLAQLAFDAAADPDHFPELSRQGLYPWQAAKLYVGDFRRRASDDPDGERANAALAIPVGTYDPLLGQSYAQLARFGLGFQRSQGISGHDGDPGPRQSYYRLAKVARQLAPAAAVADAGDGEPGSRERNDHVADDELFASVDTSLPGLAERCESAESRRKLGDRLRAIQAATRQASEAFRIEIPQRCVAALCDGLQQTRQALAELDELKLPAADGDFIRHQLERQAAEFQQTIGSALGLQWEAWGTLTDDRDTPFNFALPGQTVRVHFRLANRATSEAAEKRGPTSEPVGSERSDPFFVQPRLKLARVGLETPASWNTVVTPNFSNPSAAGEVWQDQWEFRLPTDAAPTRPYWSRTTLAEPFYSLADSLNNAERQRPTPQDPLRAVADVVVQSGGRDTPLTLTTTVESRFRDPELGEVRYPLHVVPEISVLFPVTRGLLPRGQEIYDVDVVLHSAGKEPRQATLRLQLPDGWRSDPPEFPVSFAREDEQASFRFRIHVPNDVERREFVLRASVATAQGKYEDGYETVTARDLGRVNLYREAIHILNSADVRVAGRPTVGYLMGSGDEVPRAVSMLGLQPQLLGTDDLASSDLSRFDLILVGVRAYAVRTDIHQYNERLLEYVKRGGILVVQYQTPEFDHNYGPFPYQQGRSPEEVSEEDARVQILQPEHPLFRAPNRITSADFEGWIEQRGSKFWQSWDENYTALLECHDEGQPPQQGGMLIATYGQGLYLYSAYAWYRQLPQGIAGAYRIFANILSLPAVLREEGISSFSAKHESAGAR